MMNRARAAAKASLSVAVMAGLPTISGCYANFNIPITEAPHLADNAPVHEVATMGGNRRTLGSEFRVFVTPRDPERLGGLPVTFEAPMNSEIRDDMLIMQGQRNPVPVIFPVARIDTIRVRQYSPGGTAGLVIGVLAGAATLIAFSAWLISGVSFQ